MFLFQIVVMSVAYKNLKYEANKLTTGLRKLFS